MQSLRCSMIFAVAVAVGFGQVQAPGNAGASLGSIFASRLGSSGHNADTVPASITSVTSATDFGGGYNFFASGSWIEIKGTGLATNTRIWSNEPPNVDFTDGGLLAPTSLDGTTATVNNKPAFVYYISPSQINVQAPEDDVSALGTVQVRVTNPSGVSATFSSTRRTTAPGMLAPASFKIDGKQYMVAQIPAAKPEDIKYVGRENLIPGVPFKPAKPGDVLVAYGIGFGPVTPAIAPGVVVTSDNRIAAPVTLSFGSTPATIVFSGLAPSAIGLYQFNFVVPNVGDGDYQINMTLGGAALEQPPMFLTVQR